jgi:hypothetical protein
VLLKLRPELLLASRDRLEELRTPALDEVDEDGPDLFLGRSEPLELPSRSLERLPDLRWRGSALEPVAAISCSRC